MENILQRIVEVKRQEVSQAQVRLPLAEVMADAYRRPTTRDFLGAIRAKHAQGQSAVIAEIKKASPSKGVIRADFIPADIAQSYAEHGAACLSVLTDKQFFQGTSDYLKQARASCHLPVLRKDFMVDVYQIYESRVMGADCILLIAACLDDAAMEHMESVAIDLGMSVLVEVHDEAEMGRALRLKTPLIGVNNRDLRSFEVSLDTSVRLSKLVPDNRILVAESGVSAPKDVAYLQQEAGVKTYLVGEAFMRQAEPGEALSNLFKL